MPGELNFSFSGLKTAVRYALPKIEDINMRIPDICASFQEAVIDVLVSKSLQAATERGCGIITLSGGVSCNKALRSRLHGKCSDMGLRLLASPPSLSTDNAAMIAFAALIRLRTGATGATEEDISPHLSLCSQESTS